MNKLINDFSLVHEYKLTKFSKFWKNPYTLPKLIDDIKFNAFYAMLEWYKCKYKTEEDALNAKCVRFQEYVIIKDAHNALKDPIFRDYYNPIHQDFDFLYKIFSEYMLNKSRYNSDLICKTIIKPYSTESFLDLQKFVFGVLCAKGFKLNGAKLDLSIYDRLGVEELDSTVTKFNYKNFFTFECALAIWTIYSLYLTLENYYYSINSLKAKEKIIRIINFLYALPCYSETGKALFDHQYGDLDWGVKDQLIEDSRILVKKAFNKEYPRSLKGLSSSSGTSVYVPTANIKTIKDNFYCGYIELTLTSIDYALLANRNYAVSQLFRELNEFRLSMAKNDEINEKLNSICKNLLCTSSYALDDLKILRLLSNKLSKANYIISNCIDYIISTTKYLSVNSYFNELNAKEKRHFKNEYFSIALKK